MRRARVLVAVAIAALVGAVVSGQDKPGDVALIYSVKGRLANLMQLDGAVKKHFEWHRANQDAFTWFVWQVASGENMGDFLVGTFGHHWKEFDTRAAFDEKDDADFLANVVPLVEKADVGYWSYLPEISRPADSATPTAMAQITHYFVKPEEFVPFLDALKQIRVATEKANDPMRYTWYRLISGGEGPQFVLAIDRASFAAMEPPAKTLDQVLNEAVGPQKAAALMNAVRVGTRFTRSYLIHYRPDLSYVAPK